ncbi:serine hydrolase [Bradyrhizobium sp. Arg237L]|uniref:serine hydrolase domain-containing protein n=1 Tax=Bradyrhizobium sp. Arg237L TaxID=3003352 RepID=UPI00249E7156|nr:serine hydrolase [Bradyrhizobium sp. Arg237L]MDI4237669.1 serine hydrolase [Bradyrhizobium sp. Arg237L]
MLRRVGSANGAINTKTGSDVDALIGTYSGRLMPRDHLQTFQNFGTTFDTRIIRAGAPVRSLIHARTTLPEFPIISGGVTYDIYDYVARNRIAGLLVMQNDEVLLEHYDLGIGAGTKWLSMSVAKSVSTTLVGAAIQDGYIAGVEDPVTKYLSELAGSAYEGVTIRMLMQMTSGLRWDDTQTNPASERRHMLELQIAQQPGAIMRYMAERPRVAAPGTVWTYSTGDTHVVGALVRAATGRWLSDYLSEKIWSKLGMEADGAWWLESRDGLEIAGSGLFATMRDYARFGRFILDDGVIDGVRVLPEGWVREAGASRQIGGQRVDYGYMWWPTPAIDGSLADGAFSARGIFGQFIYINPKHRIICVVLSARPKPTGSATVLDNDFWNAMVQALR